MGIVLPAGIYSDFGTRELREALLFHSRLEFVYAFQNEKRVFSAAHHAFKQVVLFVSKGERTASYQGRFRMGVGDSPEAHEISDDILTNAHAAMTFTLDDVTFNSPKSLSLAEMRTPRDLSIFRTIYRSSFRIGDSVDGFEVSYAQEVNMTSDSRHFASLDKWLRRGYSPDAFGRWIGADGDVALPLIQGGMVYLFDFSAQGWIAGLGRSAGRLRDIRQSVMLRQPIHRRAEERHGIVESGKPELKPCPSPSPLSYRITLPS